MNFRINVAYKGRHLFATDENSLLTREAAFDLFKLFCAKFPRSEGYGVSLYQVNLGASLIATQEKE